MDSQQPSLLRFSHRIMDRMRQSRPDNLKKITSGVLHELKLQAEARDVHLYLVQPHHDGGGTMRLMYHASDSSSTWTSFSSLQRFPLQLLPESVQQCLQNDQIARIRNQSEGQGTSRLIAGLLREMNACSYLMCPLIVRRKLRGVLGVAAQSENHFENDDVCEHLKLHGALILEYVHATRRLRRNQKQQRKWKRIADQACDFALSVDQKLEIRETTSFGHGSETPNLTGQRLIDVVARPFHQELKEQIRRACESGEVRTCDFHLLLGYEGPRWFIARIEPRAVNRRHYVTLYLTDNNPDKILAEEVRELQEKLLKASRLSLLGQMSTEFAHQLNQPLQAILNYCNTLQRRIRKGTGRPESALQSLKNIEDSVLHSGRIIQRIRDFVRFRTLIVETTQLGPLIHQAAMMVLPTARDMDAELIVPVEDPQITVRADRTQTTQVLVNLMVNALEACREHGISRPRITISTRAEQTKKRAIVSVHDNGPGLPQDTECVFRKFYSEKREGLGMGLAISREVCESQHGRLWAENNQDEPGCCFLFTLPMDDADSTDTVEMDMIIRGQPRSG